MSVEVSAIGDIITGGIVARTVEGERFPPDRVHGDTCFNCKAALVGKHCHDCGQHGHVHRTVAEFWHELLHGVFHFDGKIWRTLPMLFFRPGELTRRYIDGERARFVSPIALFLFSVFAMFATYGSMAGGAMVNDNGETAFTAELNTGIRAGIAAKKTAIEALEKQRAQSTTRGDANATAALDQKIKDERDELSIAEGVTSKDGLSDKKIVSSFDVSTGIKSIDDGFEKAKKNPELFMYKVQGSAYKYSWALIPLSLPFLWLAFAWRREFKLYDHIVFITYSLCFMTIGSILLSLLGRINGVLGDTEAIEMAIFVGVVTLAPLHMYFQLKGAYRLGRAAAVVRTGYVAFASLVVFVLFIFGLIVLGAVG